MPFRVYVMDSNNNPILNQPVSITFVASSRTVEAITGSTVASGYAIVNVWATDIGQVDSSTVYNGVTFTGTGTLGSNGDGQLTITVPAIEPRVEFPWVLVIASGIVGAVGVLIYVVRKH